MVSTNRSLGRQPAVISRRILLLGSSSSCEGACGQNTMLLSKEKNMQKIRNRT